MSDSESDLDNKSSVMEKKAISPHSPLDFATKKMKITTKSMVMDALTELKTRKGVSFYAIKKFLTEKYNVNTQKANYYIKKCLKTGVEDGTFIQMKGIGASGSFKLAPEKAKPKKKKEIKKPKKIPIEKVTTKTEQKKIEKKKPKIVPAKKTKMESADVKEKVNKEKTNKNGENKVKKNVKKGDDVNNTEKTNNVKVKATKVLKTPAKKRANMMKRKSIGSIIKPPKMKPKKK